MFRYIWVIRRALERNIESYFNPEILGNFDKSSEIFNRPEIRMSGFMPASF